MNFKLSKEIYGLTPWFMDVHSIPVMDAILENIRSGASFEKSDNKLNSIFVYKMTSERRFIERTWQLNNEDVFDGIGIVNLDGPITKNGGESTYGTAQISSIMKKLSMDNRIKSFIVLTDSGGGSSAGVKIMRDTINEIKTEKPVFALITKGGMACSAAYGIIAACNAIYCEDGMSIVGSVGTMIQFSGRKANSESKDGKKHIRLYATKSTKKNEGFEEALNNSNYKVLINDLLDPVNENFIQDVSTDRPKISKTDFDTGKTYFAKDVQGTYIDGLKSFEEVVDISLSYKNPSPKKSNTKQEELKNKNSNINLNSKTMTEAELKANHPALYASVLAEGVAQEQDRAGAWLAHVQTDPEAVVKGIESGKDISQKEREQFFVKQNTISKKEEIIEESADDLKSTDTGADNKNKPLTQAQKEAKEAFDFEL